MNIYVRLGLGGLAGTAVAVALVYLYSLAFGPIPDTDVADLVLMTVGWGGSLVGMLAATRIGEAS